MNAPVLTHSFTPEQPTGSAEIDLVRVLRDAETGEAVPAGTRGTVVAVHADGAAFEVEFAYGTATVEAEHLIAARGVAIIESLQSEEAKLVDYLLDVNHVDGGDRAASFLGRGFTVDAADELAEALATHAATHWPGRVVTTAYVTKHIVEGLLVCPGGSTPDVLAVWKLDVGEPTAAAEGPRPCASAPARARALGPRRPCRPAGAPPACGTAPGRWRCSSWMISCSRSSSSRSAAGMACRAAGSSEGWARWGSWGIGSHPCPARDALASSHPTGEG